jgi:CheY-like chemotaxis protein
MTGFAGFGSSFTMSQGTKMTEKSASLRVLVVDDEHVIADTLAEILNRSGFLASAVYSGESAVEAARTTRPHLVISDVVMSGMSGIETAIRIRQCVPDCKVVLISGQAAASNLLEKANAAGYFFEILSKPIHPATLLAHIRSVAAVN